MDIDTYEGNHEVEVILYLSSKDLNNLIKNGRIQKGIPRKKNNIRRDDSFQVTVDFDKSEIQNRHLEDNRYDDLMDAMGELVRLTDFLLNGDVESPEMAENICQVGKAINTYRYFEEIRQQYQ